MMDFLAPSIAAVFLGSLAFVAWLLWLKRTDERRHFTAQVAQMEGVTRVTLEAQNAALMKVDARLRKIEMKDVGLGG